MTRVSNGICGTCRRIRFPDTPPCRVPCAPAGSWACWDQTVGVVEVRAVPFAVTVVDPAPIFYRITGIEYLDPPPAVRPQFVYFEEEMS